jgi:hypothetical protein
MISMHSVKTGYGQLNAPIRIASIVLTEMAGSRPAMTLRQRTGAT